VRSGIRTLGMVVGALTLLLSLVGSAAAQTYTVTRNDDPSPAPCEPASCSLRQALEAANMTTTVDDVVVVPASSEPYILQYEELALPIADEVEVRGAGADKTVIKGDGKESIFFVGTFKATLTGLTITGGTSAIQSNGELLVRGVSIEGNRWNGGTAGIISNGPLTVDSSFLGLNRTEAASGGVIHSNAAVTIVNSTLAQNISKEGPGAISTSAGIPVTIVNSAVVSNRSELAPAAAVGGSPLTIRNNVFADNRGSGGLSNCSSAGGLTSLGGNVSDDAGCSGAGSDKPNVNPLLGPRELHGGITPVYSLLAGSPAIDATSDCPAVDQRGVARPQGSACDSGPYEFQSKLVSLLPASRMSMRLAKKKNLKLSRKGFVRVGLACVATEGNVPCRGKISLRGRFRYPSKAKTSAARKRYPSARFRIAVGAKATVRIRVPRLTAERIRESGKAKKVTVQVSAEDGAGAFLTLIAKKAIVPR